LGRELKKKKSKRKEPNPTLFVWDGSIRLYEDGSILQLHTQITNTEWTLVVEETIKYKIFLECLKQVACPLLGEPWTEEDDWFRVQLEVAVSRIRNIDPLLVASYDQEKIAKAYTKKMEKNAKEVQDLVEQMRQQKKDMLREQYGLDDHDNIAISNL
jgi:hypothetical protein